MHSFSEYLHYTSPEVQMAALFEATGPILESRLTLENFEFEIAAISEFEKALPDALNLHIDLILNGGAAAVSQYYQEITRGTEAAIARLQKSLGKKEMQRVTEALATLKTKLAEHQLNEQATVPQITDAEISKAIDFSPKSKSTSSTLSIVKNFIDTVTDGKGLISLEALAFVLDFVGLIPGIWGMAADGINVCIYLYLDKPLLAFISGISAVFPVLGDSLKLIKFGKSAKYADDLIKYFIRTPNANVTEYIKRIPRQYQSKVIQFLSLIGGKITSAFSKISEALMKFTKAIERYTGSLPKVQAFFARLRTMFERFAKKMRAFSDNLRYSDVSLGSGLRGSQALTAELRASLSVVQDGLLKRGGKLVRDSGAGKLKLLNSEGKIIREFPDAFLTSPELWLNNPLMTTYVRGANRSIDDAVKYFNTLDELATKSTKLAANTLSMLGIVKDATVAKGKFFLAIGKQLIKALTGKSPEELGMPDEQVELTGSDALNADIKQRMDKLKAEGVTYPGVITYDASDASAYDAITKYQNEWAKKIGTPEIIPVLYNNAGYSEMAQEYSNFWKKEEAKGSGLTSKFGNDDVVKRDRDFWKKVGRGEITRDAEGNLVKGEAVPVNKVVKEVPNLKKTDWYQEAFPQSPNESISLLSFNKFINS